MKGVGAESRRQIRGTSRNPTVREASGPSDIRVTRLPRKSAKLNRRGTRTGNRHRWSGIEYRGAREIRGQGTRQNSPVTSGEGALPRKGEPQRNGSGDCLTKTQGYAKPKGEVYGLTPARCWKVKRRGHARKP